MITFQVEGVERTMKNLNLKALQIRSGISLNIIEVGNETVKRLQSQFKDLTITGTFFPKYLEYWIGISRIGKEVTWIKCPTSNLFFSKDRTEGKQDIKSNIPTLDIEKITKEITNELTLKIKEMLKIILK